MSQDREFVGALLSILQRGIAEAETMVREGRSEMAADLLDSLDNIARCVYQPTPELKAQVDLQLLTFDQRYPDHYTRFSQMLEERWCVFDTPDASM